MVDQGRPDGANTVGPTTIMSNYFDDDDAFWEPQAHEATTQIPRIGRHSAERTRTHHVVARDTRHQELHDDDDVMWFETERHDRPTRRPRRNGLLATVDPRLLSIGAMSIVAVLVIPLMSALGGKDDSGAEALRSVAEAATTLPATTVAETTTTTPVVVITAGANLDSAGAEQGAASVGANSSGPEPSVSAGSDSTSSASESSDGSGPTSSNSTSSGSGSQSAAVGWSPPVCGNPYDAVAGDYWMRIADATDVSLDFLLEYNNATADTPLYPGTRVCLPLGTSGPAAATTTAPPATEAPATTAADTTAPATDPPSTEAPATTAPALQSTAPPAAPAPAPATTAAAATTPPANTEPATTAAPAPTPSGGDIEQIIRDVWPDDLEDQAVRIAWRESNFVPTAQNYCCSGLFQLYFDVHSSWMAALGITSANQLYDPRTNAEAAYALYQRSGGWGPWAMTRD